MTRPLPRILRSFGTLAAALLLGCTVFGLAPFDALLVALAVIIATDAALAGWSSVRAVFRSSPTVPAPLFFGRNIVLLFLLLVLAKSEWMRRFILPPTAIGTAREREDLFQRRDYLISRVTSPNFGPDSSPFFLTPEFREEWAIGTMSMAGAALANLAFEYPELCREHREVIAGLIERMLAPDIRRYEQRYWGEDALESLSGPNGHIGYLGHLNLLLGMHRALGGDGRYEELYGAVSAALARRVQAGPSPFLETFPDQIFIPDNAVVAASLALFDRLHGGDRFESAVRGWLEFLKTELLDPETGLIAPWTTAEGKPFGRPRGSYLTWDIFYLLQVDQAFAKSQALGAVRHFFRPLPMGLCAVREFLDGVHGTADVDSGPVIFGLSTSGTGFGLSSARALGDPRLLACLLDTFELAGSTFQTKEGRRYLLAPLIGDAIILAMRTATPWDDRLQKNAACAGPIEGARRRETGPSGLSFGLSYNEPKNG